MREFFLRIVQYFAGCNNDFWCRNFMPFSFPSINFFLPEPSIVFPENMIESSDKMMHGEWYSEKINKKTNLKNNSFTTC